MQQEQSAGSWQHSISIITLIAAMALAGSSVVAGKILISSIPVFLGTFMSLLVAFICMIPLMRSRIHELRRLTWREWKYLFLQGLCGIVLFRIFTLYGLHLTSAVQAGIITGTTPAVFAALSFLLLGEKLQRRSILGICLAVSGSILINIAANGSAGHSSAAGSLLVAIAVICEALFTIFRKRIASSVSATTNTTVLIFCSLLLLALPALWDATKMEHYPSQQCLLAVMYYGIFATVIAYLLWTYAVGRVDGATAGAATAAMPASSVLLAFLILGEQVLWQHLAGCVLIVSGIIVTTTGKRKGCPAVREKFRHKR